MSDFELRQSETVIVCRPLEAAGFVNGFSTRRGGVSALPANALNLGYFAGDTRENVDENRRRFLADLNAEGRPIHSLKQIHSRIVHHLRDDSPGNLSDGPEKQGDALFAETARDLVGVFTADCLPVLIADTATGAFAAVHAGWRGTLQRITEHTLEAMREAYGTRPENCLVALGPNASVECYEVGDEVVEQFRAEFDYADEFFARPEGGVKTHLDVRRANLLQVERAGVPREKIYSAEYCTMRRTDLFFSYRREKPHGHVGRLLSVIGRRR